MATPPPPPVEDAVPRSPSVILEDAPSTTTRTIGCWVIDKRIGRGSFATVWRARSRVTEKPSTVDHFVD